MTAALYRNIQASLRMYFSGKYSSGTWYIDRKNENMTEDTFIELQTSLGWRQDEKKAYQNMHRHIEDVVIWYKKLGII